MSAICRICLETMPKDRKGADQICPTCLDSLRVCPHCGCMTYTIKGKCGKCKKVKFLYHDITCNCYDCRVGISLKAKD